jgi:phosphomannomutase/phosphoglucomutase
LQNAVLAHAADLGLAFDGDGDRLGLVTEAAEIVWPDRVLMMFARDVLRRRPGAGVVYDVKCTSRLEPLVRDLGGKPLIWKSGHSLIKARMRETGALLGGEMSGHFVLADEWFRFDDAFYAAARLLEIFCRDERPVSEQVAEFPSGLTTPELRVEMAEGESTVFMQRLRERANFDEARLITVDGLRVERTHGWGLVRASNTSPGLVLRFEADDVHSMEEIQALFRRELLATDSRISLPF